MFEDHPLKNLQRNENREIIDCEANLSTHTSDLTLREKNDDDTTLSHSTRSVDICHNHIHQYPFQLSNASMVKETAESIAPHWCQTNKTPDGVGRQTLVHVTVQWSHVRAVHWCMCVQQMHAHVHTLRFFHMMTCDTYCRWSRSCDVVRCNLCMAHKKTPRNFTSKPQ